MAVIERRPGRDGRTVYRVKIRLRGYAPQSATFERVTDAKKWAQDTESAIRNGRYFGIDQARRHTVAELIDRYIAEVLPNKPKSYAQQRRQLLWWRAEIGPTLLSNLSPHVLAASRDKLAVGMTARSARRSPSTVVRYMAVMSHALSIAVRDWEWLAENPMRRVSKPKEPRGRTRFLSQEEMSRLLSSCRQSRSRFLYPAVVTALSTGMRRGEILSLSWCDIDFDAGTIHLRETKNGTERVVPITGHAYAVMREVAKVRRLDTTLVFPGAPGPRCGPVDLRTPWENACERAGLQDFRFHDLRHTAASYLAMGKATAGEIAELLGHKTLAMVKRYSHFAPAHTRSVVNALDERLFGSPRLDAQVRLSASRDNV